MRIIAGLYGGRILKNPSDNRTRPTSDRLRETLFNILQPKITEETHFLDLCAGTGAIGIEALSRGAGFATFLDISRKACGLIEENLDLLGIPEDKTEVICGSAEKFVSRGKERSWSIIYFDPPYRQDYLKVMELLGEEENKLLSPDGIFIAEHHSKNLLADSIGEIRRWRKRKQGEKCLSFYERS